jgi:hypothetical protein
MSPMPPKIEFSGFALVRPTLVEILMVCRQLPKDERRQWEAFSGTAFVPDEAAVQIAASSGPRWALITASGEPLFVGGFTYLREGVWRDWLLSTPAAWEQHWRTVSKVCRRVLDRMMATEAHRIECVALADRTAARDWYRLLKYEYEGCLRKFGAGGENAVIYSRVN